MMTRSSLRPQRPQMKRRPLTTGERQIRAMQMSLATAIGLWLRIGTQTMSCLLSMFLTEGFLLRRLLVPCFINNQCSYVVEIPLCCLIFHLNY